VCVCYDMHTYCMIGVSRMEDGGWMVDGLMDDGGEKRWW